MNQIVMQDTAQHVEFLFVCLIKSQMCCHWLWRVGGFVVQQGIDFGRIPPPPSFITGKQLTRRLH